MNKSRLEAMAYDDWRDEPMPEDLPLAPRR